jgi:hypothetical protein
LQAKTIEQTNKQTKTNKQTNKQTKNKQQTDKQTTNKQTNKQTQSLLVAGSYLVFVQTAATRLHPNFKMDMAVSHLIFYKYNVGASLCLLTFYLAV